MVSRARLLIRERRPELNLVLAVDKTCRRAMLNPKSVAELSISPAPSECVSDNVYGAERLYLTETLLLIYRLENTQYVLIYIVCFILD